MYIYIYVYIYICIYIYIYKHLYRICIEQTELPAKLLDYFLWSDKSNINQYVCILSVFISLSLSRCIPHRGASLWCEAG